MSEPGPLGQPDEALVDLLIKQVTEGLSPAEQRALDALDSESTTRLQHELERAAAAISMAGATPHQALPPELLARLEKQTQDYVVAGDLSAPSTVVDFAAVSATAAASAAAGKNAAADRSRPASRSGSLGWLAAAACLVLALFGWLRSPQENLTPVADEHVAVSPPAAPSVPTPPPSATPAVEREGLLAKAGTLRITLGATKDPAAVGATGDVVWDSATQTGFLHFAGLAPNDPAVRQYQLWIFDGERDARYPIDGGVFDVPAGTADIVIPIHAALMVHKPAAFAVTVEKPGGTVVSARDHVVVLGKAG
jgi:hypothetical protein